MANARITRGLGASSTFGRQLRDAAEAQSREILAKIAQVAEQRFDAIVRAEFVNDRSPDRRKTGRHLLGSSNCRVIGSSFPFELSMGSTTEGKKLGALEYGAPPHVIPNQGFVAFNVDVRTGAKSPAAKSPKAAKFGAAYAKKGGAGVSLVLPYVNHPGNRPHHMRKRALEQAIREVLGKDVSIADQ